MHLPSPTYTFSIPSLHDGTRLDCRLYLPPDLQSSSSSSAAAVCGAVVAHPYAPLGGCYDDPVVGFVGGEVLRAGCVVGTFNFRGAGGSDGRTSWTARPELADYVSFYAFLLLYLHFVRGRLLARGGDDSGSSTVDVDAEVPGLRIILGGYSYGSMIASHLPRLDAMADLVRDGSPETPIHEIYQIAEKLSLCLTPTPSPAYRPATREELRHAADRIAGAAVSYLLVSPLLPPINLFLTLFSRLSPPPADQLRAHETLAIFGDQDMFTAASRLGAWSAELAHGPGSRFRAVAVAGAGHFWREEGVESRARESIRDWLRQMS
ncbi:hypothetical protein BO70DRAFT_289187 [Aspergillus heteromorphus CBS 117.55]|uniref:AB hydrolase-1 domain-containing protein n=1 Tax=Aspergillus heteromorphus CBS 117.55 TaxID=1448321 RepID=A0A317WLX7_9EURO|nr:uncharacterized protein BO70DRAFT_289187 [Aspergillus heteromorphus CBS 117.55]PWY86018.1 hypothetical protein BO70DRAFT_289187 [Aspergillus heteromorphus CBS 117.55]